MITSSCATLMFTACVNGIHKVKNNLLDGQYPINLPDGEYNIRKLSLLEQERLQTLPDNYTLVGNIKDQKRSEMVGNGWTVSVIQYIFSHIGVGYDDTKN